MKLYGAIVVLMALFVAPADAQFGPAWDADTMRVASEMDLSHLVVLGVIALSSTSIIVSWRTNVGVKNALAAEQSQAASDALDRAARDAADRKEREGFLALLWAMQGTIVQVKESMIALNAGYIAQTKATEAHTDALTAHTAEAKVFRAELDKEFKALKKAVIDGHDKMGNVVKAGIAEGMKAAAEIFAEHNQAALAALSKQIAVLNERLMPQNKGEGHEAVSHAVHTGSGAAGDSAGSRAGDGSAGGVADAVGIDARAR